ncbi:MAG: alpha/beta hydrolase fold domain-containing protein [Acidimicrobiales bacterium]
MASTQGTETDYDVIVVGAGMAGLYQLYALRRAGFSALALETGDDVGGTWYWNRYPGARCDIESLDYSYSFDPELEDEWQWSERYATQPEILRYLQFVADKHDLRRDIRFSTKVASAQWDDDGSRWVVHTGDGDTLTARHYVMATGCLSAPKEPDVPGHERFTGPTYTTGRWPHEGVDFTGMRVGVIGTGSSAIQSIPLIAAQASELVVFQRTPNFSLPARNGPVRPEHRAQVDADRQAYRDSQRWSTAGVPREPALEPAVSLPEEERNRRLEIGWEAADLLTLASQFADLLVNAESNELACEFVRNKIRAKVNDPQVAEDLCPTTFPIMTKRMCLDTNYYETYNLPHVKLVNLRRTPITTITETGVQTSDETFEFDAIVYATGFDAMTGAIVGVDIRGRDGVELADKWAEGPRTYLGLTVEGFPNFFAITGPGSPSVLSNMVVSIEQHVDWITQCLTDLRDGGFDTIEATTTAEEGWIQHVNDCAEITLFPRANSWYMGANVPGKPRVFLPYVGGVDQYRHACNEVIERGYLGFTRAGAEATETNDGVVRFIQPDVKMLIDTMAEMGLPPLESMSPAEARDFMEQSAAQTPPGPEVGEVVDATLPGADGNPLDYRLYRPFTDGPHPVVVYFHGGGWVLGHATSDDPYCRDLCLQADAVVVSVDYRHAPEARFPAAVDDAFAAVRWVADHTIELGGIPGRLAVAGWSAGGNLAAVVSQLARDVGGPDICAQLLITPVTDSDLTRGSYADNADGYILTRPLMEWFWDHYADAADRDDPRVAPLKAADLSGLPPAIVVTSELDPLRDEGNAYAEALAGAGVRVRHLPSRGQTHTSITAVNLMLSSIPIRTEIAEALRDLVHEPAGIPGT